MMITDNKHLLTILCSFPSARKTTVSSHALNSREAHRFPVIEQGADKIQSFQILDSRLLKGAEA